MLAGPAWLIDLSRSVSRLARGPLTGIDRVELAYLRYLLGRPEPLFGLVRTALGFVLLDRPGVQGILDRAAQIVPLGRADMLGLLTHRHLPQRIRAEADARRLSLARCLPHGLGRMLRARLPPGSTYINVGHANLSPQVMAAVKTLPGAKIVVMVHDTIPLDHPQFCRADVAAAFATKLAVVAAHADEVVHTARCTRAQTDMHFAKFGRVPAGLVAPLGVELATPNAQALGGVSRPYFVALGTIEPRKNTALLIDVWRILQSQPELPPHLYIAGHRGWDNPAVFDDLAASTKAGHVTVLDRLSDGAVAELLLGAEALLFPSLAEGFGLPPLEAAALGIPVFAGPLPVLAETLGDYPVYLDTSDSYAWVAAINLRMTQQGQTAGRQIRVPPNWADHFMRVFASA